MSVVLLGMDMPESCNMCYISALKCDLWKETASGNRHSDCPFRPMPEKHGRLIDADAILQSRGVGTQIAGWGTMYHETVLQYAPTIVESEGEDV